MATIINFPTVSRSTSQIWLDLMSVKMIAPSDQQKRDNLIAELQQIPGISTLVDLTS